MLVIPALRRLRQEDQEFKDNLDYVRPWLQTQPKGTWRLHFTPGRVAVSKKISKAGEDVGTLIHCGVQTSTGTREDSLGLFEKTKQNKTKQIKSNKKINKTKQNKTKQNKTGTRITMWLSCAPQDLSKGIKGNMAWQPRGSSLELPQIIRSKPTVGSSSPSSV